MPRQRKIPKNTTTVQFDSRIPAAKIAEALRAAGILMLTGQDWKLYAVEVAPKSEVKPS